MKKESLNSKLLLMKENRLTNQALRSYNLPWLIAKLKHSPTWLKGDLDMTILLKNEKKQIILTALHEGTKINSFQANDSITFQIIEGKLRVHATSETVILNKGQWLTVRDNIDYSLTTNEETVFLLTLANNILQMAEN